MYFSCFFFSVDSKQDMKVGICFGKTKGKVTFGNEPLSIAVLLFYCFLCLGNNTYHCISTREGSRLYI